MARQRTGSGSPFETSIGFSRAFRAAEHIYVSGTGPIFPDGSCPDDAERQAARCFEIIVESIRALGGDISSVVRTRMFLTDRNDAAAVSQAHAKVFGDVKPAATMVVVAALLDPRWRIEIEADAELG